MRRFARCEQNAARSGRRLSARAGWALVCLAVLGVSLAGCERYGSTASAGENTLQVALPDGFGTGVARMYFYRVNARTTGERMGVGREFHVEPDRQVRAVLEMDGVDPESDLLLHVMWLNPKGQEVYTKEIRISENDWRDPVRREEMAKGFVQLDPQARHLEVESRYGVDPIRFEEEAHKAAEDRKFLLGTWTVRFYLFRRLFVESTFELLPQE